MTEASPRRPPRSRIFVRAAILTVAIEALTVFLRYGMGLESTRDTASTIGRLTLGLRIHHGYLGILLLLAAWIAWRRWPRLAPHLLVFGIALAASDAIHHFLVLWPIEGSPHFDLWYR